MRGLLILGALLIGIAAFVPLPTYAATDVIAPACDGSSSKICTSRGDDPKVIAKYVVNALLYILGLVSVIMIIIGGFKYTTTAGDAAAVKSAKNTIFYAVIGLAIALLSFAIVNFVLSHI